MGESSAISRHGDVHAQPANGCEFSPQCTFKATTHRTARSTTRCSPTPASRVAYFEPLIRGINALTNGSLQQRQLAAEQALMMMGITFTLRGDGDEASERIMPFDIIPRVIGAAEVGPD